MAKAIEEEEQKEESRDTPILIKTSTALLIVAIEPRLNSRREKFKNAVRLGGNSLRRHCKVQNHGSFDCVVARFANDHFAQDDSLE